MSMVCIDIDVDDYLDRASTSCLQLEVGRRISAGKWDGTMIPGDAEPWTREGLAADIRSAYYARDASRLELLLVILEQREANGLRISQTA